MTDASPHPSPGGSGRVGWEGQQGWEGQGPGPDALMLAARSQGAKELEQDGLSQERKGSMLCAHITFTALLSALRKAGWLPRMESNSNTAPCPFSSPQELAHQHLTPASELLTPGFHEQTPPLVSVVCSGVDRLTCSSNLASPCFCK